MPSDLVLPKQARQLIAQVHITERNPGLQLDKFSRPGSQEDQKKAIEEVCKARGEGACLDALSSRRAEVLASVGADRFRATTVGPLTLHLARASGLENAGIHLHAIYGFACLPGSGLKGMARAYAETVWLADQDDPLAAWEAIRAVFGWTAATDRGKTWLPDAAPEPSGPYAGAVVFHDAWPTSWPSLQSDIVNNHHTDYYNDADDPGDWESPVPVYFLSVAAGTTFDFAVSARTAVNEQYLAQTIAWLQGALVHAGAGAKTNSGYGRFRLTPRKSPARPTRARRSATYELQLATPAFLAGAAQSVEDCDLRPATLRGLLRWWWRAMHAARLSREQLRNLESAVWGNTKHGAALSVTVDGSRVTPRLFDKRAITESLGHGKLSGGLRYVAYGMDERKDNQRKQRWYIEPGARWTVALTARSSQMEDGLPIDAAEVLRQGEAALWLLCRYGGVGSRARKGFGSFNDIDVERIAKMQDCTAIAKGLHDSLELDAGGDVRSSRLEGSIPFEVETPWRDPWNALGQLGAVYQDVVKSFPKAKRAAFGLPRAAASTGKVRHAAPLHCSMSSGSRGLKIRIIAFDSPRLQDRIGDGEIVRQAAQELQGCVRERTRTPAPSARRARDQGQRRRGTPARRPASPNKSDTSLPRANERVEATLIDEKTKKGGWKAKHEPSGLEGHVQNSYLVPDDAAPGAKVTLVVAYAKHNEIVFRWPT